MNYIKENILNGEIFLIFSSYFMFGLFTFVFAVYFDFNVFLSEFIVFFIFSIVFYFFVRLKPILYISFSLMFLNSIGWHLVYTFLI